MKRLITVAISLTLCTCTASRTTPVPHFNFENARWNENARVLAKRQNIEKRNVFVIEGKTQTLAKFFLGQKTFLDIPIISVEEHFHNELLIRINLNLAFPNKYGDWLHFSKTLGAPFIDYFHSASVVEAVGRRMAGDPKKFDLGQLKLTDRTTVWKSESTVFLIRSPTELVKSKDPSLMGKLQLQLLYDPDGRILKAEEQLMKEAISMGIAAHSKPK